MKLHRAGGVPVNQGLAHTGRGAGGPVFCSVQFYPHSGGTLHGSPQQSPNFQRCPLTLVSLASPAVKIMWTTPNRRHSFCTRPNGHREVSITFIICEKQSVYREQSDVIEKASMTTKLIQFCHVLAAPVWTIDLTSLATVY